MRASLCHTEQTATVVGVLTSRKRREMKSKQKKEKRKKKKRG